MGHKKGKSEGKRAGGEEQLEVKNEGEKGEYLQPFQRRFNIWEFEEDCPVRDTLIIKHEADTPDNGRETDVFGAGQVVQNNLWLGLDGHVVLCSIKSQLRK